MDFVLLERKCNLFFKKAGLFRPPPNMLSDLIKRAVYIFASAALYEANKLPDSNEKRDLINEITKYSTKPLSSRHDVVTLLDINLDDWDYMNDKLNSLVKMWLKEGLLNETVKCVFSFTEHEKQYQGMYEFSSQKLTIYMGSPAVNSVYEFNTKLDNIKTTVRHELQHFAQGLLSNLLRKNYLHIDPKSKGDLAGLSPKKYRSKDLDIYGRPLARTNAKDYAEHELRDVEFYTNLEDSIVLFKNYIQNLDLDSDLKRELAKSWVGLPSSFKDKRLNQIENLDISEDDKEQLMLHALSLSRPQYPFKTLKEKDENKWKLAVKIFWKEIQYLL
jgi:hypothetical protein